MLEKLFKKITETIILKSLLYFGTTIRTASGPNVSNEFLNN